jgi:hypothetical protein
MGGLVSSSGRCWRLFFYFRGKRNFSETSGLCHNSLYPKFNLGFFFLFFGETNLQPGERGKNKNNKKARAKGAFFFFFFFGCGKDGPK